MVGIQWTEKEIEILTQDFPSLRTEDLHYHLPNRTIYAIQQKANRLGLQKTEQRRKEILKQLAEVSRKPRTWTQEEKRVLIKHYSDTPIAKLAKLLPKHTIGAIRAQANLRGLKKSKNFLSTQMRERVHSIKPWDAPRKTMWTEEELGILRKNYPNKSHKEMMKLLPNWSHQAINSKASKIGLRKSFASRSRVMRKIMGRRSDSWTQKEKEILRQFYPLMAKDEILKRLRGRTWLAIQHKAMRLGVKRNLSNAIKMSLTKRGANPASWVNNKPTKPELKFERIVKEYNLPFRYTGSGTVVIGGLNPDFVATDGSKKVIEVFGRAFHDPLKTFKEKIPWNQSYDGRMEAMKTRGYDCLIFWEEELKDEGVVLERINSFLAGEEF